MYILIILAELFQRDADEPDENNKEGVSDQRKEQENEIDDFAGEIDDSDDKEDVNDPFFCKFNYNMV